MILIAAECVKGAAVVIVVGEDCRTNLCGRSGGGLSQIGVVHPSCQARNYAGGLLVESSEIDFLMRHHRRPRFHPTGPLGVFINAVAVGVVSASERLGALEALPMPSRKLEVSASNSLVLHGPD